MNKPEEFEILYPRNTFRRKVMNLVGRGLVRLLTRLEISGLENIPSEGPVILAANHVSNLEPILMAVYPRRQVELMGAGDLPFEGFIDPIVAYYGFIPVNRGNLDRKAINQALGVLKQGGVLGIFPEGGIWSPGQMQAQVGVAWLSHRAQASVLPIGFSGFQNSMTKALKLKRPHLKMKIGKPIPALSIQNGSQAIKMVYQEYADMVLMQIKALVDPRDFLLVSQHTDYKLQVFIGESDSSMRTVSISGSDALAQFLFTPVMLNSLVKNLKKPVQALYPKEQPRWNKQFSKAIQAVLDLLAENPGFFTYRMGVEKGVQAQKALNELKGLLESANESGQTVILDASSVSSYPNGRVEEESHQYRIDPEPW